MKREYKLENLNCAGCASKIIKKLEDTLNLQNVNFDIISKKFEFESREKNENKLMIEIQDVLNSFHHGVVLVKDEEDEYEPHFKTEGIKLIMKLVLSIGIILLNRIITFNDTLELILYIIGYLIIGFDILKIGIRNILNKNFFDEFFLMSLASIAAMCIKEYSEAILVLAFYLVGEYFQDCALNASRKSIDSLLNKTVKDVNLVLEDSQIKVVNILELKVNDKILVKKGEMVPLDGVLLQGADFDTKSLTGEAIYKSVEKGEKVLAGYINVSEPIEIIVEKTYENSTTNKINKLLKEAGQNKSRTERFISVFAKYYTPIVIVLAFLIAIIGGIISKDFPKFIETGIIFLVVSCPCGLVLSIPLSYFAGIARSSNEGLLVKGGEYFDILAKTKSFVFDKTGTITKDTLTIKRIVHNNIYSDEVLLNIIASIESFSNHPISKSIVEYAKSNLNTKEVFNFKEISGKGVVANYNNNTVLLGNHKILDEYSIKYDIKKMFNIAINGQYIGYIEFENNIKDDAQKALNNLKKHNYELIMLTGDQKENARNIEELNLFDNIYYSLLPNEKYDKIKKIIKKNTDKKLKTCYIGDGINDSLCLKVSDCGISMGKIGSDVAIEASDVVIVDDKLDKLNVLLNISQKTKKIVFQNISFILTIKLIVMVLGVLNLATIGMGVIADVGVSLLAILNSIRILKGKIE